MEHFWPKIVINAFGPKSCHKELVDRWEWFAKLERGCEPRHVGAATRPTSRKTLRNEGEHMGVGRMVLL